MRRARRIALSMAALALAATASLMGPLDHRAAAQQADGAARLDETLETGGVPRPALWRVADADTVVFLFGSIHALRPEDRWRFAALDEALENADAVYFEAPTDLFSQAGLPFLIARLGLNPNGVDLTDQLSQEGRTRLARIAADLDLPLESLEPMRPWYAFLALSAAAALQGGADPAYGVDAVLELAARRRGKTVRTFETLEGQLRIFSDLEPATQTALLEAALIEIEKDPDQLEKIIAAWSAADLPALERMALESMRAAPEVFFRRIYEDRNRAWAEELSALMDEEPGQFLVVVGAAHLVGELSVQRLLQAEGRRVSRQ